MKKEKIRPTIKRSVAASLIGCTTKTLRREELRGSLHPIKRNARAVFYFLDEVENAVYLNYVLKDAPATFGVQAVVSPYEIKLVDDKVVFYGRAGYPNSPNPAPMPIIMPMAH